MPPGLFFLGFAIWGSLWLHVILEVCFFFLSTSVKIVIEILIETVLDL